MAKICLSCSKEYPDSQGFCTECGSKLTEKAEQQTAAVNSAPNSQPTQAAVLTPPPQNTYSAQGEVHEVVSTGYYFGMMFVYALPVIGWLICLISSFASKNDNKKHFARAILIWSIIAIVISIGLYFLFSWLGGMLMDYINEAGGTHFREFEDIFEQFEYGGYRPPVE